MGGLCKAVKYAGGGFVINGATLSIFSIFPDIFIECYNLRHCDTSPQGVPALYNINSSTICPFLKYRAQVYTTDPYRT